MQQPTICVVGSSNVDLISYTPRLPQLGETITGNRFQIGFGGKGANQAVAAAKLGATVSMITRLGDDIFGQDYRRNYEELGFDTRHILETENTSTGVAPIWVDEASGNNAIIIVPGANDQLSPTDVEAARDAIIGAQILVCQWEVPLETTLAALRIAREENVTTIFNPAPARGDLPAEAYALSDIFCPNESETELLTGQSMDTLEQAERAARILLDRGVGNVILTLGERGSLLVNESGATHVEAQRVTAVDTTGAGDAFVGSLSFFVAQGQALADAMDRASRIAALSVQSPGTQTSFPRREDLPAALIDFTL